MNTLRELLATGLLITLWAGSAYPQSREILQPQADGINLSERLKRLQSTVDRNNVLMKALAEKTADQVNRVADQVNNLAVGQQKIGQSIDGVTTRENNTAAELRVILTNLGDRMNELQNGPSAIQTQIDSVSHQVLAAQTTARPLPGPEDLMRTAVVEAFAGNYDLAIDGYKKEIAQAELNQVQDSIDTLNQVIKSYPNTSEAVNAKLKIRERRALQRRSGFGAETNPKVR